MTAARTAPAPAVIVEAGDTLSHIAQRTMGYARLWPVLAAINRHAIPNPHLITPGQIVVIPARFDRGAP